MRERPKCFLEDFVIALAVEHQLVHLYTCTFHWQLIILIHLLLVRMYSSLIACRSCTSFQAGFLLTYSSIYVKLTFPDFLRRPITGAVGTADRPADN